MIDKAKFQDSTVRVCFCSNEQFFSVGNKRFLEDHKLNF